MGDPNRPRIRAARVRVFRIRSVSRQKSRSMVSSITRVLMVLAPVIPSLKSPVIWELISRISRFRPMSPRWNRPYSATARGSTAITSRAKRALMASITAMAPSR